MSRVDEKDYEQVLKEAQKKLYLEGVKLELEKSLHEVLKSSTKRELRYSHLYPQVRYAVEKTLFDRVLLHCHGNQSLAAEILGINRVTLRTRLEKLGMNAWKYRG